MAKREISKLLFTTVYPLYVQKAERKNRTKEEVDTIICWLTGYGREELAHHVAVNIDFKTFLLKPQRSTQTHRRSPVSFVGFVLKRSRIRSLKKSGTSTS
jgi:hypothetical protein